MILAQSERLAEFSEHVENMVAAGLDAFVDEQRMAFLASGQVVTDPPLGADQRRQDIGTQSELHLQQHLEGAANLIHDNLPVASYLGAAYLGSTEL